MNKIDDFYKLPRALARGNLLGGWALAQEIMKRAEAPNFFKFLSTS